MKKLIIVVSLIFVLCCAFYIRAVATTLNYLHVLDIYNTATFQQYKDELYDITGDEVFKGEYSGALYTKIAYKVKSIAISNVMGINSYTVKVKLLISGKHILCLITVRRGYVVDAHRVDLSY